MILTAEQCRGARAMLDWTQERLEVESGVAKKTIADFERGAQIPFKGTLREIALALEAGGIALVPENGGGAGVRMKDAVARLTRRKASRFEREATLAISYRNRDYRVRLSTDILDDIDRTNYETDEEFEQAMDAHRNLILMRTAEAIDAGRAAPGGEVELTARQDFPEA